MPPQTLEPSQYRIAGATATKDLTGVNAQSSFATWVEKIFSEIQPRRIIETGTYHGTGTTTIIASALKSLAIDDAIFYSIEINPKNYAKAQSNIAAAGLSARLLNGLSVPRALLPTVEQIEQAYVRHIEAPGIFVDHAEQDRARLYHGETNFPNLPDNLLGKCLAEFQHDVDFLLLDSAGHMGNIEFNYVLPLLKSPCILALDDINHVKHYQSVQQLQSDKRFEILVKSDEKFGFCFAKFTPSK